jgi:hypothetical protein
MAHIKKGEDKDVTVTITSAGSPFDITGYNVVAVVYSNEIALVGKFANTAIDGFGNLTIDDAANGVVSFTLTNQMTSVAKEGNLWAVIKIRNIAGDFYLEADAVKLGIIKASPATDITDF